MTSTAGSGVLGRAATRSSTQGGEEDLELFEDPRAWVGAKGQATPAATTYAKSSQLAARCRAAQPRHRDPFVLAICALTQGRLAVERGDLDPVDNPLKNAPHTAREVSADEWTHPYSRRQAAWPAHDDRTHKYWPTVGRVDDVYGDRNLVCSCPPWGESAEAE